jgi:sugar lactone lactonase YvrE
LLPSGGLAVTEEKADRCQVFWPDGRVSGDPQARALAQSWDGPWGAALGPNGDLAVADSRRGRIVCLASGLDMPRWTVSLTAESRPAGLAWDSQGRLYATDVRHHRLYVVQDGALVGAWGAPGAERGRFCRPEGVAVGPAGDIYVTDTGNDRIQQFRLTIPSQGIVMEGERSAH